MIFFFRMISSRIIFIIILSDLILHFKCETNHGTFKVHEFSFQNKNNRIINQYHNIFCAYKCLKTFSCKRVEINYGKCILRSYFESSNLLGQDIDKIILEKIQNGKRNFLIIKFKKSNKILKFKKMKLL